MSDYFIGDLHFGHKNILSFDNRPFFTIGEHDKILMDNWNKIVRDNDDVYVLGDVSWKSSTDTIKMLKQLNGKKHLIVGNHDGHLIKDQKFLDEFVEVANYRELLLPGGKGIVLSHYPIPCFNKHYYGWYHLYGHVHNSFEWNMMEHIKTEMKALYDVPCNMFNVGCMMPYMNYTPQKLDEIIKFQP